MSDWYCPLPFRHAFVTSQGISPCCKIEPRQFNSHQDISTWHQNSKLIYFQKKLLEGKRPNLCEGCHTQESRGYRSLRQQSIIDYAEQKFNDTEIDFIDYRSSNICNFRCRSCDPLFSHGIAAEVRGSVDLQKFYSLIDEKTINVDEQNCEWIIQNIHRIKRLMITGGEPTHMPHVRQMLTEVLARQPLMNILITSNASFTDTFWKDLTLKLTNIHWTVSIDAVAHRAEVLRHGTDWAQVQQNVIWLAQHSPSFAVNTVISNLSVGYIGEVISFVDRLKKLSRPANGADHLFHVCHRPDHLAVDNLPPDVAQKTLEYLKACQKWQLERDQDTLIRALIQQFENYEFAPELWQKSQALNSLLDKSRRENSTVLLRQ